MRSASRKYEIALLSSATARASPASNGQSQPTKPEDIRIDFALDKRPSEARALTPAAVSYIKLASAARQIALR